MLARRGLLACVLVMAAPAGIRAEEGLETEAGERLEAALTVSSVSAHGAKIEPWVHPAMPESLRLKLEAGFELAVERLLEVGACRELFARLGADPFETLATGLYFPVDSYRRDVQACGRNLAASSRGAENLAYTKVGGAPTYLCRSFARISTEKAAVAVIHEALHHAGLTEWPHDRLAMSSTEITDMVEAACGF
jgi:hypothetical protein